MDKLQQLLNITDTNGEVITLFNGAVTLSQVISVCVFVLVVIVAWKEMKVMLLRIL